MAYLLGGGMVEQVYTLYEKIYPPLGVCNSQGSIELNPPPHHPYRFSLGKASLSHLPHGIFLAKTFFD